MKTITFAQILFFQKNLLEGQRGRNKFAKIPNLQFVFGH